MFTTDPVMGEVTTLETAPEVESTQSLWCGLVMALFAAVFMY